MLSSAGTCPLSLEPAGSPGLWLPSLAWGFISELGPEG